MLQPKRTKYRKQFKGRNAGFAVGGSSVAFGEFGLKATSRARMTAREIEAAQAAQGAAANAAAAAAAAGPTPPVA